MPHNDRPNQVVGIDYVQVELIKEDEHGESQELKFNVMTCVCLATDFAQQYIVPEGPPYPEPSIAVGSGHMVHLNQFTWTLTTPRCQGISKPTWTIMILSCSILPLKPTGSLAVPK
jgi:hypothetical protein